MFGKFFNTTEVDEFADWVVSAVKGQLPAAHDPSAKNIAQRADRLNAMLEERTRAFCKSTRLNIYKKARLAARVREGMSAHGYPEPFVKSFSFDLLARLQSVRKAAPSR